MKAREVAEAEKLRGQLKHYLDEKKQPKKKSSTPGVFWVEAKKRWVSTICCDGQKHHLGCFPHA